MVKPTTTLAVRDIQSHVLQLCDYVDDIYSARAHDMLIDWSTVRAKANQVRTIILEGK
jgi:hypothetical protein